MSSYINNLTTLALIYGNREIIATGIRVSGEIVFRMALEGFFSTGNYIVKRLIVGEEPDKKKKTYQLDEPEIEETLEKVDVKITRENPETTILPVTMYNEENQCKCEHCLEQKAFLSQTVFKS